MSNGEYSPSHAHVWDTLIQEVIIPKVIGAVKGSLGGLEVGSFRRRG
jgi:hypothetical protein